MAPWLGLALFDAGMRSVRALWPVSVRCARVPGSDTWILRYDPAGAAIGMHTVHAPQTLVNRFDSSMNDQSVPTP